MTVSLTHTKLENSEMTQINIHDFVSMKSLTKWKKYGNFESKEMEIKTKHETITVTLYRKPKEV